MAAIGDAYAPIISNWGKGAYRGLTREEQKDEVEGMMRKKLLKMMEDPDYKDFSYRSEDICSRVCKLTKEERKKLDSRPFRYQWGAK